MRRMIWETRECVWGNLTPATSYWPNVASDLSY